MLRQEAALGYFQNQETPSSSHHFVEDGAVKPTFTTTPDRRTVDRETPAAQLALVERPHWPINCLLPLA